MNAARVLDPLLLVPHEEVLLLAQAEHVVADRLQKVVAQLVLFEVRAADQAERMLADFEMLRCVGAARVVAQRARIVEGRLLGLGPRRLKLVFVQAGARPQLASRALPRDWQAVNLALAVARGQDAGAARRVVQVLIVDVEEQAAPTWRSRRARSGSTSPVRATRPTAPPTAPTSRRSSSPTPTAARHMAGTRAGCCWRRGRCLSAATERRRSGASSPSSSSCLARRALSALTASPTSRSTTTRRRVGR